jgi:hypothetical protein
VTLIYLVESTQGLAIAISCIVTISENFFHIASARFNLKLGILEIAQRGLTADEQIIMAGYLLNRHILCLENAWDVVAPQFTAIRCFQPYKLHNIILYTERIQVLF